VTGIEFLEDEDQRARRQRASRQCQQHPAAHPYDRGRPALIVDGVIFGEQCRQRVAALVRGKRIDQRRELILRDIRRENRLGNVNAHTS
jgi:hypothetical protein